MEYDSLRPDLEFELLKLVLLREKYIQRLTKKLQEDVNAKDQRPGTASSRSSKSSLKSATGVKKNPQVDIGLIGLFDVIRDCTMQVVETIRLWERTQLSYPVTVSYKWNGQNYLEKLAHDLEFLQEYAYVIDWMGFSVVNNPFLVPPEVLRDDVMVPPNSFIIFGISPPEQPTAKNTKPNAPFTKSPYLTPIINDPKVFTHLSARSKLNAKFKSVKGDGAGGEGDEGERYSFNPDATAGTNTGNDTYRSNLTSRDFHQRPRTAERTKKDIIGAYQSYLNSDTIVKLRACYKIIQKVTHAERVEYGALVSTEPSHIEFYDESRVFNNSLEGSAHEAIPPFGSFDPAPSNMGTLHEHSPEHSLHTTLPLPPHATHPSQPSGAEFPGFYTSSMQSMQHINKDLFTPSILHQAEFQASKEYFQRSLHDTSGALFAAQDAQNANLRIFPVGVNPSASATAAAGGHVSSTVVGKISGESEREESVTAHQQQHQLPSGLAQPSGEGQWGSASDAGAVYRTVGMRAVHANPGPYNDTSAFIETGPRGNAAVAVVAGPSQVSIGHNLHTTSSQLWTPHEIHLQRQVQRRGGELYVLTAAGTQGRLKAPWRRTRFERLADDVTQLHQQSVLMHMAVEEALTRAVNTAVEEAAPVLMFEQNENIEGVERGVKAAEGTNNARQEARVSERIANVTPLAPASKPDITSTVSNNSAISNNASATTTAPPPTVEAFRRPRLAAGIVQVARPPAYVPRTPPAVSTKPNPEQANATTNGGETGIMDSVQTVGGGSNVQPVSRPVSAVSGTRSPLLLQLPSPEHSPLPASSPHSPHSQVRSVNPSALPTPNMHIPTTTTHITMHTPSGTASSNLSHSHSGSDEGTDEELSDLDDAFADPNADTNTEQDVPNPAVSNVASNGPVGDNMDANKPKPPAPVYKVNSTTADKIRELKLKCIEVDRRKTFLQYQYDHFKLVSTGDLTDLKKQRALHNMEEGQTLEEDQAVAMSLEDKMAWRIQRRVRIKFGRSLRVAMLRRMNKAAERIQGIWRRCKVHMLSKQRNAQLRLALILQRWYRGGSVNETMRKLKRDALERVASKTLQRVFRGYLGRRRLNLKREFIYNLTEASRHVSIKELTPGHIEELADAVDMFVRDYTLDLPTSVLTILRGIFYLFNGDNSECVVVSKDGYIEKKYIRAATATWQGAKLILRRKSRFLRRLRALISNTCLPNPTKFILSADCASHLLSIVTYVHENDLEEVTKGKYGLLKLLEYIRCVYRAYELQDLFPEYFDPGQSAWFRSLMNIRQKYDRADLARRIQSKCKFRLETQRREYTREGRSWRHVADATKRNEFDLEEARILRNKTKKRYESYLAELEAAEIKKVATLEGIVRAKALSVAVAQGDLKEYTQSVVIPDEAQLRELYYNVDTRSVSLLQTKAEIVNTMALNERNKQSRDFDKIMKFKKLHEICADIGAVLADLMVLYNNWNSLLTSIGGYQYVKDLKDRKKALYEHIKKTVLNLIKKRRVLLEQFEAELTAQYNKVITIAYDLGAKASSAYWDTPTQVEIDAENEENRECCRREADYELRLRRQTEHVQIPPAPFAPVLLLVDSRVPRKLKLYLTEQLQQFDFVVCEKCQTDDNLVLEMQRIIDDKRHVLFFANRGSHSLARLNFVSSFNCVVSALIPTPHIVALDATLALRVQDWYTPYSVEQSGMCSYDIGDSALCDLNLGKIRKLCGIFRECLVFDSADQLDSESEEDSEEEDLPHHSKSLTSHDTSTKIEMGGVTNARVQLDTIVEEAQNDVYEGEQAGTEANIEPGANDNDDHNGGQNGELDIQLRNRKSSMHTQNTHHTTQTHDTSNTHNTSTTFNTAYKRRVRLDVVSVPKFVRTLFMADFQDFLLQISQKLTTVTPSTVVNIAVRTPIQSEEHMQFQSTQQVYVKSSVFLYSDMVLAATLATILDLWKAPLTEWSDRDVCKGCYYFRKMCSKMNYNELCVVLEQREFVKSGVIACKRLERALELTEAWKVLNKHDFYLNPARCILARWATEMVELMNRFSTQGGRADENFRNCNAAHVQHLRWREDVLDSSDGGVQLLGDLLHACMQKSLIYEDPHCSVKYYYDRGNMESTERQCIDSFNTTQHVRVYHSNEETYVGVKITNGRLKRRQKLNTWHYFARMRVRDLITMLQPNYTEIVEGKVKKYNLKNVDHSWYKLLSQWACLDNITTPFNITLLRSRYLVLSKLGVVKGYMVRMEIFEERFGEVRILVYGIQETGAVNYLVDRKKVYDLLNYCDPHAEKDKLDALDTQSVAYIFSDRLEIRPSKMWQHFLSHGELLPKTLDREVKLNLRKRQGPGRYTGRKVLVIGKVRLVITLYELDSDTNSHELRVVLYETRHSQTAEYRLSSMERLILFSDDVPLLEQICARLRHVYCDVRDSSRTLIVLEDSDVPSFDSKFEVDGDEEYEIRSQASDVESDNDPLDDEDQGSADSGGEDNNNNDNNDNSLYGEESSSNNFSTPQQGQSTRRRSRRYSSSSRRNRSRRSSRLSRISRVSSAHERPKSGWGWAIYLNRAIITENKGNLMVSVGISVPQRGLTFYVYDPRTHREAYRLVSFFDACTLLSDRTLDSIENELGNMDESVAYDLADEFATLIEITNTDDDSLALVLSGEETEVENIVVARLGEFNDATLCTRSIKKPTIPVQKVTIMVHGAKELEKIGLIGTRNPVCIVKWNFREIGRTKIVRGTLNPRYNASFLVLTPKNQTLNECSLDLELFDTSADGKNKLTDFLGCIQIKGDHLVQFLDSEQPVWMPCEKAKRFHGEENKHAKGFIEVSGTRKDTTTTANTHTNDSGAEHNKLENNSSKKDHQGSNTFGVSGRFAAGAWFGASVKNLAGTTSTKTENNNLVDIPEHEATTESAASALIAAPRLGDLGRRFSMGMSMKGGFLSSKSNTAAATTGAGGVNAGPLGGASMKHSVRNLSEDNAQNDMNAVTFNDPSGHEDSWEASGMHENSAKYSENDHSAEANALMNAASTAQPVPIYIGVVSAENLPSGTDITCTVQFNDYTIQTISNTSTQDNYMSAKVDFYSAPVVCLIPPGLPLAACTLSITLTRLDNHNKVIPLATLSLRGTGLVNFLKKGKQYVDMQRMLPPLPAHNNAFAMLTNTDSHSITHTTQGESGIKACKMEVIASYRPIQQEKYQLHILSARNLPKADVFGSSDPFVKLLLNNRLIYTSQSIKNNVNPVWNEVCTLICPLEVPLSQCTLLVEVYDYDNVSDHDLLGSVTVAGAELVSLLCPDPSLTDVTKQNTVLTLEAEQKAKGRVKVVKCGDITLRGGGRLTSDLTSSSADAVGAAAVGADGGTVPTVKGSDKNTSTNDSNTEITVQRSAQQKLVEEAYEELHNSTPEVFVLSVNSARGLLNIDSLKHSMTHVNVYFNGALVGHTAEVKHGATIGWTANKDSSNANSGGAITLILPRGQLLSSCRLEIEVVASVHHTSMMNVTTTTSTVLGARIITGDELCALVGIVPKPHSTVSSASHKTSRKAISPSANGETFVALEESTRIHNSTTFVQHSATALPVTTPDPAPATTTANIPSTSAKVVSTSHKKRGAVLDAAGMAQANETAATLALPSTLTPQGEVSLVLKKGIYNGDNNSSVVNSTGNGGRLKDIVIEEPELVRENSLLLLNVKNLQGVHNAIAAVKRLVSTTSASAASTVSSSSNEVIDVSIKWNGVLVDTFFAVLNTATNTVTWPQEPSLVLRLPLNLTIQECHLDVLFAYEQTHIGCVVMYGEALNTLAGRSVNNSNTANPSDVEQSDNTNHPTADAITTKGTPLWCTLVPSPTIPVNLHSPTIEGRCMLQGTLVVPIVTKSTTTKTIHRTRKLYPVIHTDLAFENSHWEYTFEEKEIKPEIAEEDHFALDQGTPVITKRRDSRPSPAVQYRKRLMSDISRTTDHSGDDSSVHNNNNNNAAAPGNNKTTANQTANANNLQNLNNNLTAGLMGTRAKTQKLQLELSAIGFTVTVHQEIDEYRTCWRGRVLPKNFSGSEATRKALMVSRASRLVRTHGIADMQVMAEIHQLNDMGDAKEEVNDLPICVKEILSDGPGLVLRTYRVEISANNGVMMGSADIQDNEVDLARVIGEKFLSQYLPADRKMWKLGSIFEHVVRERVILDMLMGRKPKENNYGHNKDGRREGVMQAHDELADLTGSIITIMRDPSPEEVAMAARAALDEEKRLEQEKLDAEAAAAASAANKAANPGVLSSLSAGFRKFGFGFTYKKPAPVAVVAPIVEEGVFEQGSGSVHGTGVGTRGGLSTRSGSIFVDEEEKVVESYKTGRVWLRIHARTHRIVGKSLRSVVLLLTTSQTAAIFLTNPERFFKNVTGRECLLQFDVLFRCKDSFTKETRELYLTSDEIDEWLPQSFEVDLTTRFRRDKVGAFFLQYLSVRFTESGKMELYLIKENVNVSSSIDDLIAEDEEKQKEEDER